MKIKPMIFNTEMVRALLDGRKVQTRRPVKVSEGWELKDQQICRAIEPKKGPWGVIQRRAAFIDGRYMHEVIPAPAMPGDLTYVRETHGYEIRSVGGTPHEQIVYRASKPSAVRCYDCNGMERPMKWRPSIHMPRWASRLTLKVTGVRVERVQDISRADCISEGFTGGHGSIPGYMYSATPKEHFTAAWQAIYRGSWERNDWVWVIDFEVIRQNVDEYLKEQENKK